MNVSTLRLGRLYRETAEAVDSDAILRLLPQIIVPLSFYDLAQGSAKAEAFRTLFLRMADSIVNANGCVADDDRRRLERFREVLYGTQV